MQELQSAYSVNHSTKIAVLCVLSDILDAMDCGDSAVHTVDHATLLRRLQTMYSITGNPLVWFSSYLHDSKISVCYRGTSSTPLSLLCGVPQGLVIGQILFFLYTADLLELIEDLQLHLRLYADDTQICGFCAPADASDLQQCISVCVDRVSEWMQANR